MALPATTFVTPEQYLAYERATDSRNEYIDGRIYQMEAATRNHSHITANTVSLLREQLRGRPCAATGADTRVHSPQFGIYTYPDVVVSCGPDKVLDGDKDTLVDATLIVEVLSPSTQNYDRGEKFRYYRSLPSFAEYLLLAQDEIRAEHHIRQPNGLWLFGEFTSPDYELALDSIGCRLVLGSLYERVDFSA